MKNIRLYANYSGSDKILLDNKFCNRRFVPAHHKQYISFEYEVMAE